MTLLPPTLWSFIPTGYSQSIDKEKACSCVTPSHRGLPHAGRSTGHCCELSDFQPLSAGTGGSLLFRVPCCYMWPCSTALSCFVPTATLAAGLRLMARLHMLLAVLQDTPWKIHYIFFFFPASLGSNACLTSWDESEALLFGVKTCQTAILNLTD